MTNVSLSSRLALIIVSCSLAAILAVAALAYHALNEDFEIILTEQQIYETRSVSEKVSQNLQLRLNLLQAFSGALTDGDNLRPHQEINALLNRQDALRELFSNGLLVLDETATAIAEDSFVPNRLGTNYADRAHFAEVLETRSALISRPIIGRRTGVPLLSFVAPIQSDDGDLLGFLSGSINLNKTSLIPKQDLQLSKRQRAEFLVIDTNNFLYVENPATETEIGPLPDPGEDSLIDAAMSGIGIGEVITNDGERLIYATSHLQRLGWLFIRAVPQELAKAPARESFEEFALLSLIVILVVAPLGYLVTRSAMIPLDRMTRRIRKMATSNSSTIRLDEKGPPEVRKLAAAFNKLLEERDAASRLKDDFVSNISHELRTPLTSLNGALRLITSGTTGQLPEKAANMSNLALRNGERLQLLIADLLDFNKLTAGEMVMHMEPQALEPIVEAAVQGNYALANESDVHLAANMRAVSTITTDAHRLRQILDNFISNAIKFSPAGGEVTITTSMAEDNQVRITVSDQGKGFPEEFQPRLFERFAQAEGGTTRALKGTGLGLAISRELATLLGGRIGAYNDNGAHFWVELPVTNSNEDTHHAQP